MSRKKAGRGRKREGNGSGTLELRGNVWLARWMAKDVDGHLKRFARSTGETVHRLAELKLSEFLKPYQLSSMADTLIQIKGKLEGTKAEIQKFEDAQPAMTIAQAWEAFKASPSRPQKAGADTLMNYQRQAERLEAWLK
jgi:hypothetical protein